MRNRRRAKPVELDASVAVHGIVAGPERAVSATAVAAHSAEPAAHTAVVAVVVVLSSAAVAEPLVR